MYFKIHRGTSEIGGSCVEIGAGQTRIIVDFGLPLVTKSGDDFNFNKHVKKSTDDLVSEKILPDISGLYGSGQRKIDGVLISHAHADHFGLSEYIDKSIKFYLSEATHEIIKINSVFTNQNIHLQNTQYFKSQVKFSIGDIEITPYSMDHSAFDGYGFLIEAEGKKMFYSGDFRAHGRKDKVFKWFTHNAPKDVDYLFLEGTSLGRAGQDSKSEYDMEKELIKIFKNSEGINLIYTSGQNIDRLVSIYKACMKANKTLVVDVYVAKVLKTLNKFASLPYPSKAYKFLKVIYPYYTCKRLKDKTNLYEFRSYKITKEEIDRNPKNIIMVVRPSMKKDLEKLKNIDGGRLIYSMWKGYKNKTNTKEFLDYLRKRKFQQIDLHTSGHADHDALQQMVDAINPQFIVPIHTFQKDKYKDVFNVPVKEINDGDVVTL